MRARDSTSEAIAFGVDIGGTKILGVALDRSGAVLAEVRIPTPDDNSKDYLLERAVIEIISNLLDRTRPTDTKFGIGVGVPGMIDKTGVAIFAPNLFQVVGIDFAELLTHEFGDRVIAVDNDANFAAFAEHRVGSIEDVDQAIVVTIGTGIGCGLIIDGSLSHGARGLAGEAGHMIVDPGGKLCKCARRGCWETYASGSALGEQMRNAAISGRLADGFKLLDAKVQDLRGEHLMKLAYDGNVIALEIIDEFAWWIALGLANIAALSDPEVIVLAGGLFGGSFVGPGGGKNLLLRPVTEAFSELVEGYSSRPEIKIKLAALGESAGAIGAALTAMPAIFEESSKESSKGSSGDACVSKLDFFQSKASSS